MILRSSGFGRVEKYEKCQSFDADGGGGLGGGGGDLESIEKCDLLPTASLFCILHLLCHPTLQYISDEAQAWHNIERAMQP